jgi:phage-related protein (TIGR01555 family)
MPTDAKYDQIFPAAPTGVPAALPQPVLLRTSRVDQFVNAVTGLGGVATDRAAAISYERECIPTSMLIDQLYTTDWLAARIVEKMPSIALVRGFGIEGTSESDAGSKLLRDFAALNSTERYPEGAFQRALYDGRAYGCAGLFLGYKLGNPLAPLTDAARAGGLAFLDVFRQHELRVVTRVQDPGRGDFGMPEIYEVISGNGMAHPRQGQRFHASRLLRFMGLPLRGSVVHPELPQYPEVGVSVLAPVIRDIARYGTSWAAVSHLLQDASIGVMKIAGLVEALASEDKAIIEDRLSALQRTKAITRLMFLDADNNEDFTRVAVSFADIPGVMAQIILSISGAADMPAKILFGTSPAGLNANSAGEADLTQFYNSCDEYRKRVLGPKLETVLQAISSNPDVRVTWPSLWDPTDNEKAQTRLTNANATKVFWDIGAVQAEDVVKAAKDGVAPETIGKPSDVREDPAGEGFGGAGPKGASGNPSGAKTTTAGGPPKRAAE